jgi:hypothetical protein
MKKMLFSFGAVIILASFNNHPGKINLPGNETTSLQLINGKKLSANLSGTQEPTGGDPDGSGTATFDLDNSQGTICYYKGVENITQATAAHIHFGAAGVAGPVVAELFAPHTGSTSGVVVVDKELIKKIRKNPEMYYVNVHNSIYPDGAIRGQLSK